MPLNPDELDSVICNLKSLAELGCRMPEPLRLAATELRQTRDDLNAILDMLTGEHKDKNPGLPIPDWITTARSSKEARDTELRAIAGQLAKTADGEYLSPQAIQVFHPLAGELCIIGKGDRALAAEPCRGDSLWTVGGNRRFTCNISECYSTHEAATAAMATKKEN